VKLTVFGATGGTGKQLIEQALAERNDVISYARNPTKFTLRYEHLTVVQGELHDRVNIERAVNGADAVVSQLGPRPGEGYKSKPLLLGIQNIIGAMKQSGVDRLIVVSTPSAAAPDDLPDFKYKVLVFLIRSLMRPAYEEIVNVARAVQNSGLDWTIVRVSILNNNPKSNEVRAGYLGKGEVGVRISRADIAGFILKELKNGKYINQMPVISN
jgi:putative NADH-flavin reductase